MKYLMLGIAILLIAVLIFVTWYFTRYSVKVKKGTADKIKSLKVNDDGSFRILQITDTHLMTNGTDFRDAKTLKWVSEAIKRTNPDFVEVTGDVSGWHVKYRNRGLLAFANLMEKKKVYWCITFGNHDGEYSLDENGKSYQVGRLGKQNDVLKYCANVDTFDSKKGKLFYSDNTKGNEDLYELLKGYEYCLTRRDKLEESFKDEMGVGNFVIELVNKNDEVVFALIHMDTHGKAYINPANNDKGTDGFIDRCYVGLTNKQIEWYKNIVKPYSEKNIKTAIFMHISTYGFRSLVENFDGYDDYGVPKFSEKSNVKECINKFKDTKFVKKEDISAPLWDDGLEAIMNEYRSTNLIAVGHEHDNCFYAVKDIANGTSDKNEVIYGYGRCCGENAWGRKIPIGATVYDINTNGNSIYDIYNIKDIYPEK